MAGHGLISASSGAADDVLSAPLVLEYPFTRTTGPVIGRFLTGLREGVITGIRRSDGSVMCPPLEYDPLSAESLSEADMVELGTTGEVLSWTWNGEPRPNQPFARPFAWALIRLDGADTPMLHGVLVDDPDSMATGMKVQVRWAAERSGHITDIAGFVPLGDPGPDPAAAADEPSAAAADRGHAAAADGTAAAAFDEAEPVRSVRTPIRMEYTYTPGRALSAYLRAMKHKRILGDRCGETGQVFVPPRGVSPMSGKATTEMVELVDTGYIESFNVTRVPIKMRPDLTPPYTSAWIVLDGASVGFMGLAVNIAPSDVRIGMRVRAVWKPDDELEESATNILGWEPTGEPDEVIVDYERIGRADSATPAADTDTSADTSTVEGQRGPAL